MTISYNWLSEYLPVKLDPERLSKILTSIGLEVESLELFESIRGGLKGLVVGEVMSCEPHPNADKLKVTSINIGEPQNLQVVCGAANVAKGQKVVLAPVGATIYPAKGDSMTMKVARIRGVESYGMICAEDEIGVSHDHSGIMVLPSNLTPGTPAAEYFKPFTDYIFEIGLTPNRMDAMSHLGVARDVCAYLIHHDKKDLKIKSPFNNSFKPGTGTSIKVVIENKEACRRYSGVSIKHVKVDTSPQWLQERLISIGQRPINNIVDITNFILHETGQPLHAFDITAIKGNTVLVKNLPEGTVFKSLDEKERKLSKDDLIICNGNSEPMCIAGVFGGIDSGVKPGTTEIFLESAWFNPVDIRKTSFRHNLRTEAATRFEKNIDISNTINVLKRAALLIKEIAGGVISSDVIDVYPAPKPKAQVTLKYHFLKKLSGKNYHPDTVRKILSALDFEIDKEGLDDIRVTVPFSKPDVSLPADIVEEVMRIDGLDNIEIPSAIMISPSVESDGYKHTYKEKIANFLAATGFNEIFTNSITNAAYFSEDQLSNAVRLLNNLSAVHNIMRPSMLVTGLEAVAYNINRRNYNIRFFEFGKTYNKTKENTYVEKEHLCIYLTGNLQEAGWKNSSAEADIYYLKGLLQRVLSILGADKIRFELSRETAVGQGLDIYMNQQLVGICGSLGKTELAKFDIKQPVFFADLYWETILASIRDLSIKFTELPRQLPVTRDLAMVVDASLKYEQVEQAINKAKIQKLSRVNLFDVFTSDKLGEGKKSMALNFTFLDEEKTLTDKEIDEMMSSIMDLLQQNVQAEIRK
ncbi:MAG TPA: phenylalanine--tRNA ligase subunit beta [Flavitalea sp.]|nr:phenylalanine--tRNA ligase subunit beta [Flavitalea sp.]